MPAKSTKGFCLLLVQFLTLFFMPHLSLAREIEIDGALKVELVNNKMSNEDALKTFNYVKSVFYDDGDYYRAEKGFREIVDYAGSGKRSVVTGFFRRAYLKMRGKDYDDFNVKDDALYYIARCQHHRGDYSLSTFEQVYYLYPDSNIVKSGQLQRTLVEIAEPGTDFDRIMGVYSFLAKNFPEKIDSNRLINIMEAEFPHFDNMMQIYNFIKSRFPREALVAESALKARTKEKVIVLRKTHEEKLDNWRGYTSISGVAIDAREWTRRQVYLRSRLMAKNAWDHFTAHPLTDKQLNRLEEMVKDKLSFSNYEAIGGNEFYPSPHTMKCEVSLKCNFHDLLEGAGIDLFEIGK